MKEIFKVNSISQVHEVYGLAKPKHPLISLIPVDDKIIGFDYGNANYVLDFYQVSLKTGFFGSFNYGRNSYDFEEGSLIFTKPGQTIQIDSQNEMQNASGWILLFHPDLIRKSQLGQSIENYSFFDYDLNEALHLSDKEKALLTNLVEKIEEEYNQNIDKHSQELIIANIEMLLKYCKRFYDRQFYTRSNLNKDVLTEFSALLKNYFNSEKPKEQGILKVKYCADQLNYSVKYFGDLIKTETGRSPKDHINDYIVEKAKNQLLNSNISISEIAYNFGFEFPQGFNKLFKNKVGTSPSQYRSLN